MNTNKKWYQSKTLWFNAVSAALAVVFASPDAPVSVTPEETGAFFAVGNIILRLFTNKGVGR